MKITSININGFGKFQNKAIDFGDGLNVIFGKNEAGKSTTHTFIKSMLFGMKKRKLKNQIDTYSKYLPWDKNCKYEGTLCFSHNGKNYQIHRIFSNVSPLLEVREIGKAPVNNPELFLNRVLCNLTIDTFDNTISIGQMKSAQDTSLIQDLHRYIANLNTSGSMSINTMAALNFLKHKKENLSLNLNMDATIIYNKQLGTIRNIEKEISNKSYENHLPEILSKKTTESKQIEANEIEINKLKTEIAENQVLLENYGFNSTDDVESLKTQTEKIFFEYKPFMNDKKNVIHSIINILFIILGIIMITFSTLLIAVTYPQVASILNLNNINYSMSGLTNFVINLPFHPIILIGFLCCIGIIIIAWNILMLLFNYQNKEKANEIHDILADIFNQHINDDTVDQKSMFTFRKHIRDMKNRAENIDAAEARIIMLTKQNNELLSKQSEYEEKIKNQQKIQYDVEKKYKELNVLRTENEKMKQSLNTNDNLSREIESIDMAIDTLSSLSDEIQVMFGTHLNKAASAYISGLTGGKYSSLNVDNSLNITINHEGRVIPLSQVSTGTIDQIYLAMRLATADIIRGNKEALPLIFDDCFAMYDNDRLESSLKYLNNNFDSQIIIFTCHTREQALLAHNNIPFNKFEI